MARMMKVRRPTTTEIQRLSKRIQRLTDPHQRRRADSLTLYGMGLSPLEIAEAPGVHPNTVYKDLHAFEQLDLEAVTQLRRSGVPGRMVCTQRLSGGERQVRTGRDEFRPISAHPSRSCLGGQNRAIQMPLCARQFQALGDDLFAATFNDATANQ